MAATKRTGTSTSTRLLLVATAAVFSILPLPTESYSGTVPIFPDIAAGKSKAAAVAYEAQCRRRYGNTPSSYPCSSQIWHLNFFVDLQYRIEHG